MTKNNKNILSIVLCALIFIIIALAYTNPILVGKELIQHDIVQYKGGASELIKHRIETDKETYWSNAMFGGMPTYQTGARFEGDVIKKLDSILNFLPRPANYIFLLFSGFFFLGMVALRDWKYALLGATMFGLSTYFYIIMAAGHNAKVHTIAYFAPLLASIFLVYIRKKYIWGFISASLFMALQINANHPQMTYYLFIGLISFFISEFIITALKRKKYKHFFISTAIIGISTVLGLGMNSQRILANSEYIKETVRGKQLLSTSQQSKNNGLDKASITMWSYGKLETLNLFIPRIMGGASNENGSEHIMNKIRELVQQNAKSQQEIDNIRKGFGSLTYWGDQPMTSGPAYQGGVVIFLALLGFFFTPSRYKWWILISSILTIMLSWGSNFAFLTDFFIDYVPIYNKFRAPSSILVIVELLFPLIAIFGIHNLFYNSKLSLKYKQKILINTTLITIGVTIFLILTKENLLGFHTEIEKEYLPNYLLSYLINERYLIFKSDAIKAILCVSIVFIIILSTIKQKISKNSALILIGIVSLIDIWYVDKCYLNNNNFIDKIFVQNPFITEIPDSYAMNSTENSYIESLLYQSPINKSLESIAKSDSTHYRVYNTILGTFNETNTSNFVHSIGGYSAVKLRRYDDIINKYFSDTTNLEILNLLNTKYILTVRNSEINIEKNPDANGPVWFVNNIKFVNSPDEEINAISKINTKKIAVISKNDKKYFDSKPLENDEYSKIELVKYFPNEIIYNSSSKTSQLAVFSEVYYPYGWKFYIDGEEKNYIKANYFLRAIHVPKGEHEIKMIFEPKVIHTGKIISLFSTVIFILLCIFGIWVKKFHKKKFIKCVKSP